MCLPAYFADAFIPPAPKTAQRECHGGVETCAKLRGTAGPRDGCLRLWSTRDMALCRSLFLALRQSNAVAPASRFAPRRDKTDADLDDREGMGMGRTTRGFLRFRGRVECFLCRAVAGRDPGSYRLTFGLTLLFVVKCLQIKRSAPVSSLSLDICFCSTTNDIWSRLAMGWNPGSLDLPRCGSRDRFTCIITLAVLEISGWCLDTWALELYEIDR
jgi:hypothetical protein